MEGLVQSISTELSKHADVFQGLILMGSIAAGSTTVGSDIDLLILTSLSDEETWSVVTEALSHLVPKSTPLLMLHFESKVAAFVIMPTIPLVKLDFHFGKSLQDKVRYLRGSEQCRVLWSNNEVQDLTTELATLMLTKAVNSLNDYQPQFHISRFLETFELLCKNVCLKDSYRVEFYGWILRHSLVVLERISRGERTHLYLPKRAFEQGDIRHLPIISLDLTTVEGISRIWTLIRQYTKAFSTVCNGIDLKSVQSYDQFLTYVISVYEKYEVLETAPKL